MSGWADLVNKNLDELVDEKEGYKLYPNAKFPFTKERAEEFAKVGLEQLIDDPYFLNQKWNGEQGVWPKIKEILLDFEQVRNSKLINTFIFTGPIGAGKSSVSNILLYWQLFEIIIIPQMNKYFNMMEGKLTAFCILSKDADAAKRVTFIDLIPVIIKSPFIVDYYPIHADITKMSNNPRTMPRELRFPKNIVIYPGSGRAASALGYNIYGACFTGDTQIRLADGSINSLKNLCGSKNIELKGFDLNKRQFVNTIADEIALTNKDQEIYEIELEDGSTFKATKNQQILTFRSQRGKYKFEYKRVNELSENDNIATEKDFIKCKICGRLLTQMTPSHLKEHGVKFSDYIKGMLPEEFVCQTLRERAYRFQKENYPQGHSLGRKHSEESKKQMSQKQKGRIISQASREKMEIAQIKKRIKFLEKEKIRKEYVKIKLEQYKEIKRKKWSGKGNPRYGKDSQKPLDFLYKNIYFRGSWDMKMAQYLDSFNIKWIYEPERFEVCEGYTYLPDFYLPSYNVYIEVKSYFRNEQSKMKFELFSKTHPIILIQKEEITNPDLILRAINENKIYKKTE